MKMQKISATSSLNVANLSAEDLSEVMDWRNGLAGNVFVRKQPVDWKPSWCRFGLQKLVDEASEYFIEQTKKGLPYNLSTHGPWVQSPRDRRNLYEGDRYGSPSAEKMIETAARFSSWLRIIADDCRGLRKVLATCLDYGMNAKRTCIDPYDLVLCWNSPLGAERSLQKALRRAKQILEPFGVGPSWQVIGGVMTSSNVSHRTGKMAFAIAARTVNHYCGGGLTGSSVEILTKARGIAFLKQYYKRKERVKYASWAVSRVEAGEFTCLREAFEVMESRLADWGNGTMVDTGDVVSHYNGRMTEVPIAFRHSGVAGTSYFVCGSEWVQETEPIHAWQKFLAAKVILRHYHAVVNPYLLRPYGTRYESFTSPVMGVRAAISQWLSTECLRNNVILPIRCFKGWRYGVVNAQVKAWAFRRIIDGEFRNFGEAHVASSRLVHDETDGVSLLIDPTFTQIIHKVVCKTGWDIQGGVNFVLRQIGTGRTFHTSPWKIEQESRKNAVKQAIVAWRRQSATGRKKEEVFRLLQPKNACILVWFEDSLDAGNCSPGTRAWAERNGFNGDMLVPAVKLLKHGDDPRVLRVLQMAAEKVAELKIN